MLAGDDCQRCEDLHVSNTQPQPDYLEPIYLAQSYLFRSEEAEQVARRYVNKEAETGATQARPLIQPAFPEQIAEDEDCMEVEILISDVEEDEGIDKRWYSHYRVFTLESFVTKLFGLEEEHLRFIPAHTKIHC